MKLKHESRVDIYCPYQKSYVVVVCNAPALLYLFIYVNMHVIQSVNRIICVTYEHMAGPRTLPPFGYEKLLFV